MFNLTMLTLVYDSNDAFAVTTCTSSNLELQVVQLKLQVMGYPKYARMLRLGKSLAMAVIRCPASMYWRRCDPLSSIYVRASLWKVCVYVCVLGGGGGGRGGGGGVRIGMGSKLATI